MNQYNTKNSHLILREYGRNIQKLVNYVTAMEDREERTKFAHILVDLMRQINPSLRESQETSQKCWDDLYIMSEFKLDVDAPFPMPEKTLLGKKPQRLKYHNHKIHFKHYGRNIEILIEKAIEMEDEQERKDSTIAIGRLMKSFYATWNRENIESEQIINHIKELSDNKLDLDLAEVEENGYFVIQREKQHRKNYRKNTNHHSNRNNNHSNRRRRN